MSLLISLVACRPWIYTWDQRLVGTLCSYFRLINTDFVSKNLQMQFLPVCASI